MYYYPHFTDEGTETQRGQLTCPQFISEDLDSNMTLLYCPRLRRIMVWYDLISLTMCLTQQNGNSTHESSPVDYCNPKSILLLGIQTGVQYNFV